MEEFKINAVFSVNGNCYHHFGIRKELASIYGDKPEDIRELLMKVSDDQVRQVDEIHTKADYWGWYDNEKKIFTMIYPKRFLLEMCFPNMQESEDRNQGKAYRLEILK